MQDWLLISYHNSDEKRRNTERHIRPRKRYRIPQPHTKEAKARTERKRGDSKGNQINKNYFHFIMKLFFIVSVYEV